MGPQQPPGACDAQHAKGDCDAQDNTAEASCLCKGPSVMSPLNVPLQVLRPAVLL